MLVFNQVGKVKALLEIGADPNVPNMHGMTPLFFATGKGLNFIVRSIASRGVAPKSRALARLSNSPPNRALSRPSDR